MPLFWPARTATQIWRLAERGLPAQVLSTGAPRPERGGPLAGPRAPSPDAVVVESWKVEDRLLPTLQPGTRPYSMPPRGPSSAIARRLPDKAAAREHEGHTAGCRLRSVDRRSAQSLARARVCARFLQGCGR